MQSYWEILRSIQEGEPFQSLLSTMRCKRNASQAHTKLINTIMYGLHEEWSGLDYSDSDEDCESSGEGGAHKKDETSKRHCIEAKQRCVCMAFCEMIERERHLWRLDYFTFYRVVDKKYVLYQFNTLMLSIFNDTTWGQFPHRSGLICTPSLYDSIYPGSLQEILDMFKDRRLMSDSEELISDVLISVNNCLTPIESVSVELHSRMTHHKEASPVHFFEGYDETSTYIQQMERFMHEFFDLTKQGAEEAVEAMFTLYKNAQSDADNFKGHCLQICVPFDALSNFAYPCVSWGKPVKLFMTDDKKLHAFEISDKDMETIDNSKPVSLAELLRRTELCELQTRILAHPNLFLTAGAVTNVFHANPKFDRDAFRMDLFRMLEPFIKQALAEGKSIKFSKFCHNGHSA